jgi:hypothetical protein
MHNEFWRVGSRKSPAIQAGGRSKVIRGAARYMLYATAVASAAIFATAPARATAPRTSVAYQPMVGTGVAARNPFEAWFVFNKSFDPTVPGYAIPAGATVRFTFPKAFTPRAGYPLEALMIKWEQGSVPAMFTTVPDSTDPRTIVIHFDGAISPEAQGSPGLKAIHLRANEINPAKAGDYPITIRFIDAGPLSGTTKAIAHITPKPVPNVAAYNQLHQGKDEDWQHVKAGADSALPIDFLVTIPDAPRSVISLKAAAGVGLSILRDGNPIGSITTKGVPMTLTPEPFGPGFSRLGIVEVHARAGATPGSAEIVAALEGGTQYVIHLSVDGP